MSSDQPHLAVLASADDAAALAAELVVSAVDRALQATGRADVAVMPGEVTGLIGPHLLAERQDWSGVHFWVGTQPNGGDPTSGERFIRQHWPAPGAVVHTPPPVGEPEKRALAYSFQLKQRVLDVVVLQLGDDGTIAGLAPDDPALGEAGTIVATGSGAVSLGLGVLQAATQRLLLATGAAASEPLRAALGDAQPSAPASLLPATGTTVIADRAARG